MSTNETIIDLLRHGETTLKGRYCGSTDAPLTALGHQQMVQALNSSPSWDQVISSPLVRCAEFAQKLSNRHSTPVLLNSGLQEMHFGHWENQLIGEVFKREPEAVNAFWQDPVSNPPPQGELLTHFRERVLKAFQYHVQQSIDQHILMIVHGGVIRVILADILNMPIDSLLKLEVPHAALSRVRVFRDNEGNNHTSLVFHSGQP